MALRRRPKPSAADDVVDEDVDDGPDPTQPAPAAFGDAPPAPVESVGLIADGLPAAPEPASSWDVPAPRPAAPPAPGSAPPAPSTPPRPLLDGAPVAPPEPPRWGQPATPPTAATPTAAPPVSAPPPPAGAPAPAGAPSPAVHPVAIPKPAVIAPEDDNLPVLLDTPQLAPHLVELKVRAQDALIERMGARLYDRSLTEDQIEAYVISELSGWLFEQDVRLSDSEKDLLTKDLLNDVLRHGPIEPFLDDESVTEIMVNGMGSIYIERKGKLIRSNSSFLTEAHLRQVIERIVSKIGRRIDESSPMVDARLPDGSRVNAVIPPLAVDGPSLTIRKFTKEALTVEDLVDFRTLTPGSVEFLSACVRGRLNVLVSGGTGTGKTTLLNVLSNFIPDDERIVTIEDAVELQLRQDHIVRLESRPPNVEGRGQVTIRDLVRNSLRMRPDRVIIGECRGSEALDMLQAMNTGHDGSLSTLHANGPRDAVARLETLCLMAGMDLPMKAIREQISSAVDVVVHVARLRDGTRRVTHVSEVLGLDGDDVVLSDLFVFDYDAGLDLEGKYAGRLVPTGVLPSVVEKLHEHGVELDTGLFATELVGDPA